MNSILLSINKGFYILEKQDLSHKTSSVKTTPWEFGYEPRIGKTGLVCGNKWDDWKGFRWFKELPVHFIKFPSSAMLQGFIPGIFNKNEIIPAFAGRAIIFNKTAIPEFFGISMFDHITTNKTPDKFTPAETMKYRNMLIEASKGKVQNSVIYEYHSKLNSELGEMAMKCYNFTDITIMTGIKIQDTPNFIKNVSNLSSPALTSLKNHYDYHDFPSEVHAIVLASAF